VIRVECSGCGKRVRGGDDWSGRSGHCPKCGAVILFPDLNAEFDRAEIAARESAKSLGARISKLIQYPNLGKLKFVAIVSALGISLWVWNYLIVVLAYGRSGYHRVGLRVVPGSGDGIHINNGDELNVFWHAIYTAGFLGLWYLLMTRSSGA
jgi:hypothetical protein